MEVHNEIVRDLLQEPGAAQRRGLVVREIEGDVVVQGAREVLLIDEDTPLDKVEEPTKALRRLGDKVEGLERDLER